jgi:magnesium transporter
MKKLTEMESTLVPQEQIKNYYDNLAEHSQRIWEFSEIQKEIIESLHDTSESVSSYRINNIMKTLTIVSVIIMPLNLFINLFGMNFNPSPPEENIKLFMNIILISSLSGLLLLLFFKKKKWL